MSRTKKTVIVDVIIRNSVKWADGVGNGWKGKSQRVGQLLLDWGPEWMGIRHHEQETGPPSKSGFFVIFARALCIYWLIVHCVNLNEIPVCRLKINHAWSAPSSCVKFLGTILVVVLHIWNCPRALSWRGRFFLAVKISCGMGWPYFQSDFQTKHEFPPHSFVFLPDNSLMSSKYRGTLH